MISGYLYRYGESSCIIPYVKADYPDIGRLQRHLPILTLDGQGNPHSDAYAKNKENMLDWEGNMVERRDWAQILLSEVEIDSTIVSSAKISKLETKFIDDRLDNLEPFYGSRKEAKPPWRHIPCEVDNVASVLCSVSLVIGPTEMCSLLCEKANVGQFKWIDQCHGERVPTSWNSLGDWVGNGLRWK